MATLLGDVVSGIDIPETCYARTDDGLSIAYQTFGEGPRDMVFLPSWHCIDLMWEDPAFAHVLQRLGRVGRVICFDARGFGASDPVPLGALPTPEAWMEDARSVLDAVGSTKAALICHGGAGFFGMLCAATYPQRTSALVFIEGSARMLSGEDYPFGLPPDQVESFIQFSEQRWGTGADAAFWAPSRANDAVFCRWLARYERGAWSPASYGATFRWVVKLDLRSVLPAIRVPTLVLHRESGLPGFVDQGRYLAEHISGARLVVVTGSDFWFFERADEIVDHVEEFLTGEKPLVEIDRVLATVLFTDIVGSTDHAARLGDRRWREVLDAHDNIVRRLLGQFRGQEIKTMGDGFLATFDGPARSLRCACAVRDAMRSLGIEVRAGLHTGEVEMAGGDVAGIAVHIGQRVSALARPGEVLVSRTVVDLVAGSGINFEDRGEHELRGLPGAWRLFAVEA